MKKIIILLMILFLGANSEEIFEPKEQNEIEISDFLDTLSNNISSVLKVERDRNYLYTYPPFPHPSKGIIKIKTYWDQNLPFSTDDLEIYNISGQLVKTNNSLQIEYINNYSGYVVWDVSSFNNDIFFIKIKHGTEVKFIKILVL